MWRRLKKGQRLLNNLHLFNGTEKPLQGESGTLYKPFDGTPAHEAEIVLTGSLSFTIDPGLGQEVIGRCRVSQISPKTPIQVFAVAPHMHMLGKHLTATIERGEQRIPLFETDYVFDEQVFTMMAPAVTLQPGDVIETVCRYDNTTGKPVSWGDSSKAEMCFTDIFYYPAQGARFVCAD